ncbi:hypothetical protein WL40_21265 [Burkholderia ubonensis]|uniref:DUF1178 family protein n=1 Tax=Burkholderia ubonensis TaxID=101571 RepID=UPI000752132E|nr:DUF1178 family protein [Burkholderia ubonensis]KVP75846.1 hypothetical protein WJ92_23185 [Burkholderia ubonensis]KVX17096.1 hypothetical protein WL02_14230 [Burkholderia ubonensis]KWB85233.1 hypothetical protein WL40_21265 [Burkholderia ubonensis]KWB97741.1 hypothetical protein WL44_34445 [Burkholderia ubonensis]KWC38152.1 hypothetical protein WL51_14465 [Burkholderia ubonensis]
MKVLDLQCPHGHRFEGWFASADEFEAQLSRKLVECPVCGVTEVSRMPSAPRLNLSGGTQAKPADPRALQAQVMRALREVLEKTENVGERFAEEARRIHYNEAPVRSIRGVTTPEDAQALVEEGIDVMPLPIPGALKETLQ